MKNETYFLTGERHEYYINLVITAMKEIAPQAYRAYAHSEDGEAVVGTDEEDNLLYLIHFDPESRNEIDAAVANNQLIDYLKAQRYEEEEEESLKPLI